MRFFEDLASSVMTALFAVVLAVGSWLFRNVLTNGKKLALLEQKTDMQHKEAMTGLGAVKDAVREVNTANQTAIDTQSKIVEMLQEIRDQ